MDAAPKPTSPTPARDFTKLPPGTPLDETIGSVDADPVPDPHAGRNVDQDHALREG